MTRIIDIYQNMVPVFLKKLIDPETIRVQAFARSTLNQTRPFDRVLDAGAGECRNRQYIENRRYVAIDAAIGDNTWNYNNLDAIAGLEDIPFQADLFDLVLCTQVLEHVREPQLVLEELFRVIKPGGRLCLTAPQGWGVHQAPFDFFRYTNYGLEHLLRKAGFEIVKITPSCGFFGYLANRLTMFPKTLFWNIKKKWLRLLLLPFELLVYLLFVFIFPALLNNLDFLDKTRNYTLNYFVLGTKPAS